MLSGIPFLKSLDPIKRLFIVAGSIALIVAVGLYFLLNPTIEERLTEREWCVTSVDHISGHYHPRTVSDQALVLIFEGCEERMIFTGNSVTLPGFQTQSITARWKITQDSLEIMYASNFKNVYEGKFAIEFRAETLKLTSDSLTITATQKRDYWIR